MSDNFTLRGKVKSYDPRQTSVEQAVVLMVTFRGNEWFSNSGKLR